MNSFRDWQNVSATVTRTYNVPNASTGVVSPSTSTVGTYKCIFWIGRAAERVVSEKIRTEVDAVGIFDVGRDIQHRDTLTINSVKYNVIDTDNVAFQNEALVVALAEIA